MNMFCEFLFSNKLTMLFVTIMICTLMVFSRSSALAQRLIITDNAATDYVITVAADATAQEKHAAKELSSLLREASGATFEILTPEQSADRPQLAVGYAAAKAVSPEVNLERLGPDGIVIRSYGKNIVFSGGKSAPRGTLYAVYTFLEDFVGYRWWTGFETYTPKLARLAVRENVNVRYVPVLDRRDTYYAEAFFPDWSVRNKNNGFSGIGLERGGSLDYAVHGCHTFEVMVPPKDYFDKHPEWFSEIDGKRTKELSQLCLTNPEVLQHVINVTKKWLKDNPNAKYVSITQNDWRGWCTCENCRKIDEEEGGQSGTMIRFVNAVAEAVEQEFPDALIDTFAYQYTRKAPKITKPRDNVVVRLCSIECDFSKPLNHPANASFVQDIKDWAKISKTLYIWDYVTNFGHYLQVHPNLRVLAPNVRFFVNNKVKGIFEQGAYQSYGSDMGPLRTWVLAKLLWNPRLDAEKLIKEFTSGYYGPAAPYIDQYLKLTNDISEHSDFSMNIWVGPDTPYTTPAVVARSAEYLERALDAVKDYPEFQRRVEIAQVSVLYSQISNIHLDFKQGKDIDRDKLRALLSRFTELTTRENITRAAEGTVVSDWIATMKLMLIEGTSDQISKAMTLSSGEAIAVQLATGWKFATDSDNVGVKDNWFATDLDDSKWSEQRTDIACGWESQGFPDYTGFGWYRQTFDLAESTGTLHRYLYFGAIDEEAWIYVNGQLAFEHSCAVTGLPLIKIWMTPFMFDVSELLNPGQTNTIAVRVSNQEQMGGIWRPVYMVASDNVLNLEQVEEAVKVMQSSL